MMDGESICTLLFNLTKSKNTQTHTRLQKHSHSFSHSRWKGDHGGNVQLFFPSNYVEEVSNNTKHDFGQQV